jgi:predicted dehydrogenase
MNTVRLGIIGMGNIGRYHTQYLREGRVKRCELVAVCDSNLDALEPFTGIKLYAVGEEMICSGNVDAVIIATPHFQHTALGIAALSAGVHALVEKPISSHKADALRLVDAHHAHPKVVFAGMFQLRVEPRYLKIRKLLHDGELGNLVRVNWINTDWFRSEAYYAGSAWRATWKGEGGGVLLNQCLHNLDVLQWICGMPARVRGFCKLGRFHDIEVEDDVSVYLEWGNGSDGGATGTFISSTGESPGTNRLEIVGTRGKLVLEDNQLHHWRNEADMIEFARSTSQAFATLPSNCEEIAFENAEQPHATMVQNFVDAILDGVPLIAPGEEGINSVELANAMVYSSLIGQIIELPMDGSAWEKKLNQLIGESTHRKRVVATTSDDFARSFRK